MSSKDAKRYDPELQMFIEKPKEPNLDILRELRWRGLTGRLEHPVLGEQTGEFAPLVSLLSEKDGSVTLRKTIGGIERDIEVRTRVLNANP